MKKHTKTLFLASGISLFVLFTTSAQAQFSGGVRAGVNFATEQYTGYEHEFLALPYAGLYAQYQVSQIGFQLGANYSGQGTNLNDLGNGDTYHYRQSYLTFPFLVQGHFAFGGYIELGAQYGFLLSSSESYNGGASVDTKDQYKSTDFEIGGGIGYEFNHTASHGLGINIRYMRGVTSIAKSEYYTDNGVENRVLSAGLTYRF
jgi:hypothetical protein